MLTLVYCKSDFKYVSQISPLDQEVHSQSPQWDQEDHLGQDHPTTQFKCLCL